MVTTGQQGTVLVADDELLEHYLAYTGDALKQLDALLPTLEDASEPSDNAAKIEGLHSIAHNIKGMGTSFGFPLMTNVGALLCSYLRALDASEPAAYEVVSGHLKAMHVVLDNRIIGDGEEVGAKLLARLEQLISETGAP